MDFSLLTFSSQAKVTCRELGFLDAAYFTKDGSTYGSVSPPFSYVQLVCSGKETKLR